VEVGAFCCCVEWPLYNVMYCVVYVYLRIAWWSGCGIAFLACGVVMCDMFVWFGEIQDGIHSLC